ncbi:enoyl-CoA hydratase [Methylovirgula sp. 4M-Z18]|uniref:enoyl-CoA hydratase n=1 Tax=Methylovirgula sp. 4M-Z18 TaxID=2293567 RepID=UPI000E2F1C24|nr:enoyl-CoA hydratase [Methylovirgula sp. 4M-Z18]RFB79393.1 enoyl-CoA hydratase [Methylovirgula sp. 4M-Z18]
MPHGQIRSNHVNGLAWATLFQPAKLNALSLAMWQQVPDAIARAEADPLVRAIVMTGEGEKAFSAGADIGQFADQRSGEAAVLVYEEAVSAAFHAVLHAGKPTIALIRGVCFGGGFALSLCCDLRYAREDARFRIPAARLGLGYASANVDVMVRKLGLGAASELLLTARAIDSAEALRLGAVQRLWPAGSFDAEAAKALQAIAQNAPLTLRAMKAALNECVTLEANRNFANADRLVEACFRSADYREGQAAFKEKREPDFKGE